MDDIKKRILEDPDFINLKKYNFSIKTLLEKYPDGAPSHLIARGLDMAPEDVERFYDKIVQKLRTVLEENGII